MLGEDNIKDRLWFKVIAPVSEFGKRWFVLEHGTLSYFENEKVSFQVLIVKTNTPER